MKIQHSRWSTLVLCTVILTLFPQQIFAFCGTYLSDANEPLFNDATQVALMRSGTTTVLSMANTYEGPVKDFAMVVPVPVVLQQNQVKTLDPEVFARLDRHSAPRLVAYQEKDPCKDRYRFEYCDDDTNNSNGGWNNDNFWDMDTAVDMGGFEEMSEPPVTVEAKFAVGEYDIVVLSANDSSALQTWLMQNNYKIPQSAGPVLQSYIQQGMYFFVAKINAAKTKYDKGRALLSPLRFHYESTQFSLPVRLGMVNSKGEQDLIVYILADNQRYEVSNYPNVTIPTNINVKESVANDYADFYENLFAKTVRDNPKAVVTEYAWGGGGSPFGPTVKCDPCPPEPGLDIGESPIDYTSLGGDVLFTMPTQAQYNNFVLTRLHARYKKEDISADLIFTQAPVLQGGTGTSGNTHTQTQTFINPNLSSAFQGRYIIHKRWKGSLDCQDPVRYRWGADAPPQTKQSTGTLGISLADLRPKQNFNLVDYRDNVPPTQEPKFITCEEQENPTPTTPDINDPDRPYPDPNRRPLNPDGSAAEESSNGCAQTPALPTIPWIVMAFGALGLWWRRRR